MRVFSDLQNLPVFKNPVLTIGSFDGVHGGHRHILDQIIAMARERDGESIVITFDPHPRTVLRPDDQQFATLSTRAEKTALLESCGVDNLVFVPFTPEFAALSAQAYVEEFLVQKFHPACIVIGYDHRFGNNREGDIAFLRDAAQQYRQAEKNEYRGFEVVEIPAQLINDITVSSSKIRRALESADIQGANRLLSRNFLFSGIVEKGNQIGRTIGFPTANIALTDPWKIRLPQGIYAAKAWLGLPGRPGVESYGAMLYIGDRPTLPGEGKRVIEANLLNFEGDLYGKTLFVEVLDFIRPDKKLPDLEALRQQIQSDQVQIEAVLAAHNNTANPEPLPQNNRDATADPKVAIVILNYNTRKHLETYLPSVIRYSPGARIIVADNGSPDDSVAFLQREYPTQVEVIALKNNYGFAQGYNEALKQVKAEIYVILNSDVEVSPGWMAPVLDAMRRDPAIGVAQPKILAWRERKRFEYAGASGGWIDALGYPFCRGRIFSHSEEDRGQYDTPQACFWASGAAFFIRAELYHRFEGFDGDYFAHNEEIDLCWRLKRAGYGVWCFPQSVVWHLGGGTLEYENPRKTFLNFRNSLFSLLKNESVSGLLLLIPARLVLDGVAGVRFLLKGQFRSIWAIVRAHFSFYRQLPVMLEKRRRAAEIIENARIGPYDRRGILPGSIVWKHYAMRVKEFGELGG